MEARVALYSAGSRQAEDARVQIRKHHQAAVKKGNFKKRSQELEEVRLPSAPTSTPT